MKVSFLHTLSSNQALFAPYISTLLLGDNSNNIQASHHLKEELLQDARKISNPEEEARVKSNVHQALSKIVQDENDPEMIVCTCSTIGDMAETYCDYDHDSSSSSAITKVLRVDRPMAMEAVKYDTIHVLAALESTVQPTLQLLQECAAQQQQQHKGVSPPTIETTVIPQAWSCFQAGDLQGYAQTIATYIQDHYSHQNQQEDADANKNLVLVLAQASMSPAAELLDKQSTKLPRILTSPGVCMEYLSKELQASNDKSNQ